MINAHDLYTTDRVFFCYLEVEKEGCDLYIIESYDNEQFVPDRINFDFWRDNEWLGSIGTRTPGHSTLEIVPSEQSQEQQE